MSDINEQLEHSNKEYTDAIEQELKDKYDLLLKIKSLGNAYGTYGNTTNNSLTNSQIRIDTVKLRTYAERLRTVNKRLSDLDRRMNNLYLKVGLRDLFNLLQAGLLTGSSERISNCAKFLDETANDFDTTERNVTNLF